MPMMKNDSQSDIPMRTAGGTYPMGDARAAMLDHSGFKLELDLKNETFDNEMKTTPGEINNLHSSQEATKGAKTVKRYKHKF